MATAMSSLVLLLFFVLSTVVVVVTAQKRNSNITLGSSLSPNTNSTSWLSSSGRFAFGFYPEGNNNFTIGIWLAGIPQKTIIWTAKQEELLQVPSNATLLLTNNNGGGLILKTAQGQDISISDQPEQPSSAAMLDTGNFVLYNSKSDIIWQSFDSPTNTILQGQRLSAGVELFSRKSETDQSKGRFRLKMQHDGNLVQYPVQTPDTAPNAYWASQTNGAGDYVTLNLDDDGQLYLLNSTGFNIRTLGKGRVTTNGTIFFRMTLDVDGIFRVYSHTLDRNSNWSIMRNSTDDRCAPKGLCGLNGYCTLNDQEPVCLCIPGFRKISQDESTPGCEREVNVENCESKKGQNQYRMSSLENTEWEESTYSSVTSNTKEECGDACLRDCNCEAALFENQLCKKQRFPLRYGKRRLDDSKTAFIKVGAPSSNDNNLTEFGKQLTKERKKDMPMHILVAGVSFVASAFIFVGIFSILFCRYGALAYQKISNQRNIGLTEEISLQAFTYNELEKATDGFKEVVGRGSFGTVFKGALSNGQRLIAVKRLEGVVEEGEREFQTEMRAIGRTHHRNLVNLLGYCHEGSKRLLVYEYMSNGSLADFLFKAEQRPDWNKRVETALNLARGILYLHDECETQIIHCDIKPQNILIDEQGSAKISDFGLAKLLKADQTKTFTGIRGTRGYVAPEWHRNLPITVKVDVYSFGIVLLEIICCRRSLDIELADVEVVLVDWVCQCFDMGELDKLVNDEEVVDMRRFERMVRVALWSIQEEPSLRPSMKKVVLMLEGTIDIPTPPSPSSFLSSI